MEDYSKTPSRSSSYVPGSSTFSSPRGIAAKDILWCGRQIPGILSGINYERKSDNEGYYHLDQNSKYQAIINGINKQSRIAITVLHIHMIKNNVVVSIKGREGMSVGEKTAHFEFPFSLGGLSASPTTGNWATEESIKELAGLVISEFAAKIKLAVDMRLPKNTLDQMGKKYGGEEYKRIVESLQKVKADRNKQFAEREANENLITEHQTLIKLASSNPFLTVPQSTAAKLDKKEFKDWFEKEFKDGERLYSDYEKEKNAPIDNKRKEVSQEEERDEKRQRRVTDLTIDRSIANKIMNNLRKKSSLLVKVHATLTSKTSNKDIAKMLHNAVLTKEDWLELLPNEFKIKEETEAWEIVQAIQKAL